MKPRMRDPSYFQTAVLELILLILCIVLALAAPGFLTAENLLNVLRNVSMQGVIAFGMTMVIIAGEIDLSVGSAVAFSGCLTAYLTQQLTGPAGAGAPRQPSPWQWRVALDRWAPARVVHRIHADPVPGPDLYHHAGAADRTHGRRRIDHQRFPHQLVSGLVQFLRRRIRCRRAVSRRSSSSSSSRSCTF